MTLLRFICIGLSATFSFVPELFEQVSEAQLTPFGS
jgi:hypothetical protein